MAVRRTLKTRAARRKRKQAAEGRDNQRAPAARAETTAAERPTPCVQVAIGSIADLAVEWWRLERWAVDDSKIVGRHVARRVARFLEENGIEVVDLTGKPYEAGLAAEVLERIPDDGEPRVEETVSPIVLWKGTVVKQGQVVTKGNGGREALPVGSAPGGGTPTKRDSS